MMRGIAQCLVGMAANVRVQCDHLANGHVFLPLWKCERQETCKVPLEPASFAA
jgi:hypothetical protein